MLNIIKMSKPKSCSACSIAMLAGKSFDEALRICFEKEPEDFSMDFDAMEKAIKKCGLKTKRLECPPSTLTKNTLIECRNKKRGLLALYSL